MLVDDFLSRQGQLNMTWKVNMPRFSTYLIIALGIMPLWVGHYLPMVDLPQHAAQIATFFALDKPDFPFKELFLINWFNPYLVGYLMTLALALVFPVILAVKLVLTASLIAYFIAFKWLREKFKADAGTDWLVIPTWYGFAFNWGFYHFLIGLPLFLIFLGLVMQSLEQWNRRNAWLVAVSINILFFTHALLAGVGCLIALELVLLKRYRIEDRVRSAIPIVSVLPIALFWLILTKHREIQPNTKEIIMSFGQWPPFGLLNPLSQNLGEQWWVRLAGLLLFALPIMQRARTKTDLASWAPFLSVILIVLLVPTQIFATAFVSDRFSALIFPFYLLGFAPASPATEIPPIRQRLESLLPQAIAMTLIMVVASRIMSFNLENDGFTYISRLMAPEKRALTLTIEPYSSFSTAPVYINFPAWYQVEKLGIVDYSMANSFPVMVRYHRPEVDPFVSEFLTWRPSTFDWNIHQGWKYDYFVVRATTDFQQRLFGEAACPVKLVANKNHWWLYEREEGGACSNKSIAMPSLPK
ncbi:hypothetical protein [Methylomagnum sp.]